VSNFSAKAVIDAVGSIFFSVMALLGLLLLVFIVDTEVLRKKDTHVHLACVDPFTQQSFQTDRSITRVEVWPEAYALHRNDGTLTVIQRTDNMVCNLSTEYQPDANTPNQAPAQP
jgi:hypothetical protein